MSDKQTDSYDQTVAEDSRLTSIRLCYDEEEKKTCYANEDFLSNLR